MKRLIKKHHYGLSNIIKNNIRLYVNKLVYVDNPLPKHILYRQASFKTNNVIPNDVDRLICETEGMNIVNFKLQEKYNVDIAEMNYQLYQDNGYDGFEGIDKNNIPRVVEAYVYFAQYNDRLNSQKLLDELAEQQFYLSQWEYITFIINHNKNDTSYNDYTIYCFNATTDNSELDEDKINNKLFSVANDFKQLTKTYI